MPRIQSTMAARRPQASRRKRARTTVLVAPAYLEPLRSLLNDTGWEIEVAANAAEVRNALAGSDQMVLVLGADLPDADGFELCETLKSVSNGATPQVIMVTDQNEADQQLRAFKAGADEILTMPISRYQLVLRIRAQIRITQLAAGASYR